MDRERQLSHPGWCENLVQASSLKPGERVLVVVDEPLAEEGAQLVAAVRTTCELEIRDVCACDQQD